VQTLTAAELFGKTMSSCKNKEIFYAFKSSQEKKPSLMIETSTIQTILNLLAFAAALAGIFK
jgi:hypothetical protein